MWFIKIYVALLETLGKLTNISIGNSKTFVMGKISGEMTLVTLLDRPAIIDLLFHRSYHAHFIRSRGLKVKIKVKKDQILHKNYIFRKIIQFKI